MDVRWGDQKVGTPKHHLKPYEDTLNPMAVLIASGVGGTRALRQPADTHTWPGSQRSQRRWL